MQLGELIHDFDLTLAHGDAACSISDITDDSRCVSDGSLFIARADGEQFIDEAVHRGAAACVTGDHIDQALAGRLAERFFGEPAKRLKLIGVTGTNGKTTAAFIIQHLLAAADLRPGLLGTVCIDDGRERRPAELTTPGAIEISRLLHRMVANGCNAAVLEASSHALKQGRTDALAFDVAVFTNLSGDHFDYHDNFDDYLASKARLFTRLDSSATAVTNVDDAHGEQIVADCPASIRRCGLKSAAEYQATVVQLGAASTHARFTGLRCEDEAEIPLIGEHNLYNVLQAIATADAIAPLGERLPDALADCPAVPGRLEPVHDGKPTVLVDYAHTDDALRNVLTALRPLANGRLLVLFGCGGDRDKAKRPRMAAVACELADHVVITSDNPRNEDPAAIIEGILAGVPSREHVDVEPDRGAAIRLIIDRAGAEDIVLIAGKGHEDYQIVGDSKRHFDDREEAAAALSARVAP